MKKLFALFVFSLCLLCGNTKSTLIAEDVLTSGGKIDWKKISRDIDAGTFDKDGRGNYASFVIHKDEKGNPEFLWICILKKDGKYELAVDVNGNNKFDTEEVYQPQEKHGQGQGGIKIEGLVDYNIESMKLRALPFDRLFLSFMGDPDKDGLMTFVLSCTDEESAPAIGMPGNPADRKNKAALGNIENAPCFDLVGYDVSLALGQDSALYTQGKTSLRLYLISKGSNEAASSFLSNKTVGAETIEMKITYPKAGGGTATIIKNPIASKGGTGYVYDWDSTNMPLAAGEATVECATKFEGKELKETFKVQVKEGKKPKPKISFPGVK